MAYLLVKDIILTLLFVGGQYLGEGVSPDSYQGF